jgi:CBS domain-containing protein
LADNINIVLRAIIDANTKDINAQIATLSTKVDKLKIKLDLDTDGLKNIQNIMQDIKKLMTFNNSKFKLFDGEQIKKDGIKVYDTLESIEKKYKKLGQPITYTDKTFDTITKELTGFTMQVEKADGVIEKLKYSLINISNGTDISKGFVLQGMNQIDKTAQIQEKALRETQRIKLKIQQEEEKASTRRMNLLHKEALAMNKVFDKNKISGSTTNTNASSSAIISQISSIDKLILRYKAAQMSIDEFLKYGNKIVASDNFRNKSLEQQAKLIQALEGAERKLIQTRTQASNVGERQAKLSTQENMKMLNEAYAMNRAFDAEKQRTFNLGTNLTGKTSGFTGADKGSVEKYAKEIYGADAAVIKFNQTLDKNGKLVSEATVKVNKNAKEYSEYKLKVDQASQSINQFGGSTDKKKDLGMFDQFKVAMEKFPIWIVASTLFMQSINAVRDGLKYVLDMDTALTNLSKVTTLSSEQLDEMRVVAVNLGGDLARSSTEIMKSMAEFGRVFKDTESIKELTTRAVMMSNVTTLSADESAKALNTTMITFKKNVGDASHILDSFNEIQNNFRKLNLCGIDGIIHNPS